MTKTLLTSGICIALLFFGTAGLNAGSPYVLSLSSGSGVPGDGIVIQSTLDNGGGDIQGWSFGVCHDVAHIQLDNVTVTDFVLNLNDPDNLGFLSINFEPGGFTMGVVIDLFQANQLPPGAGYHLLDADYTLLGASNTSSSIDYCSTLGTVPVSTVVVVDGQSIPPLTNSGTATILSPNFITVDTVTGILGQAADVSVLLTNEAAVDAVQVALTYPDAVLASTGVDLAGAAVGAEFFGVQAGTGPGELAVGLVMDTTDPLTLTIPVGTDQPILTTHWNIDPGAPAPSTAALTLTDGLGNPPINNIIVIGQTQETPNLVDGAINIVNFNQFLRADCNNDDTINIADGIYLLNFLFQSGPNPVCNDACDFNDDGGLDSTDAIAVFNYRFLEGAEPSLPFPTAGFDPTNSTFCGENPTDPACPDAIGCNGDADDGPLP